MADAVVTASGEGEARRLVAYVVRASASATVDVGGLRTALAGRLPDYMIPAAFVVLDRLPLTPNGKIDRLALPSPDAAVRDDDGAPPRPGVETLVAGVWQEVLGVPRIGRSANFFALGGHSLLAAQVMTRLRSLVNVALPLRLLFDAPTVAGLATAITAARATSGAAPPPLRRDGLPDAAPLSYAQQRLWLLDRLQPGKPTYNVAFALDADGPLNLHALRRSLSHVVQRHHVLRTTFSVADGVPVQQVAPAVALPLPLIDLSGLDDADTRAGRLAADEARQSFDLRTGPLLRARVVRLGPTRHLLLLTVHHIVCDGWSTALLLEELTASYRAYCDGVRPRLAPLPVQYADFARWQRAWVDGDMMAGQLAYWERQLAGVPALALPLDAPRPAIASHRGGTVRFSIPPALARDVNALSQREGVTLFMTLLAVWQAVLSRLSGQMDVAVGTVIANRPAAETEGLIGFFVNQLVLRTDLSGGLTGSALLARVRQVTLDAYAHQDVSFEQVVAALKPERDLSRAPLCQTMLILQNTPSATGSVSELTLAPVRVPRTTAKVDLSLDLEPHAEGLTGLASYAVDLFKPETIAQVCRQFLHGLETLVRAPAAPIDTWPLLDDAERERLVQAWNDTSRSYPAESPHERIALRAEATPDAIALVAEDAYVTCAALDERAARLANVLRARGVGPEVCVGLCVERTADLMVAVLGVWKAGGAYVPLDPSYPIERLAFVLNDAAVRLLVTDGAAPGLAAAYGGDVLDLTREAHAIASAASAPWAAADPATLAYVIYTSGSTGQPKGVMIEHRAIANDVHAVADAIGYVPGFSSAMLGTIAADLVYTAVFLPLCFGGALHVIRRDRATDPARLAWYLARHPIDCVKITPSHLAALQGAEADPALVPEARLLVGGESLSPERARRIRTRKPGCAIINHYGPTETAVGVLTWTMPDTAPVRGATLPLGRPIGNARVYVLAGEQLAPIGAVGELYIGGAGVARGYLRRPDLTAERFVPDPFRGRPGARLFRTGDRVRWLAGGTLEFLGRVDDQIKIRGHRVEPGEIQALVSAHPAIRECAVLSLEEEAGRLVAFVVPAADADGIEETVRQFVRAQLPSFMIPSRIIPLERLPLTANGKIDREALRRCAREAVAGARRQPPRDSTEATVAQLFQELLEIDEVAVTDDFFDRGGHSISAVRLAARLGAAYGVDLPVRVIFERPTVEALGAFLRQGIAASPPAAIIPLRARGAAAPLFCVHPAGGLVHVYLDLARHLGAHRPFFGIQSVGLDAAADPLATIADMASTYVAKMRAIRPDGPYHLAGWSMGATVAYEMACQLRASAIASTSWRCSMAAFRRRR